MIMEGVMPIVRDFVGLLAVSSFLIAAQLWLLA